MAAIGCSPCRQPKWYNRHDVAGSRPKQPTAPASSSRMAVVPAVPIPTAHIARTVCCQTATAMGACLSHLLPTPLLRRQQTPNRPLQRLPAVVSSSQQIRTRPRQRLSAVVSSSNITADSEPVVPAVANSSQHRPRIGHQSTTTQFGHDSDTNRTLTCA